MLLTLVVSGVANGLIYATIALGIVILIKSTGGVNFAHGDAVTVGGFLAYTVMTSTALGYFGAGVAALASAVAVGIVFYTLCRKLFEPKHAAGLLVATIGLSFVVKGACRLIWGGKGDFLSTPPVFDIPPVMLSPTAVIPGQQLVIGGGTLLILAGFALLFRYSRIGLFMRAAADNPHASDLVGIRKNSVLRFAFVLSLAVAALSGVLLAPYTLLHPDLGFPLFVKGFAAAIVGGIHSLPGAVVGGILIGAIENVAGGYVSTHLQDVSAFLIILLALTFIPGGLFGGAKRRAV